MKYDRYVQDILDVLRKNHISVERVFDMNGTTSHFKFWKDENPSLIFRATIDPYQLSVNPYSLKQDYRDEFASMARAAIEALNERSIFMGNGIINIKGLDKAKVLKALYDHSHIQGLGFLQAVPDGMVSVDHCRELLKRQTYFDYLYGKVLKVDLSGDTLDTRLYDRDCGEGAAERAIRTIL